MSRDIDALVIPELTKENYRPLILFNADFPSGFVYAHSGVGDILFNANTYKGVGQLGKVSVIEETNELKPTVIKVELSGVDPALISVALNDNIQGRSAEMYLAFLDDQHQVIGTPVGPWSGRMDIMSGELGNKTATIQLEVESRLADWERPRMRRYTDADQQQQYPGDKGLEFVNEMQEKEIQWGPK